VLRVFVDDVSAFAPIPGTRRIEAWLAQLFGAELDAELSIRIVGEAESRALNRHYRGRDAATNVLSFAGNDAPADSQADVPKLLGDIVICAPIVAREAVEQGKPLDAHWAHLAIHGVLHLLGYDHEDAADALVMQRREAELLGSLGYADPYEMAD